MNAKITPTVVEYLTMSGIRLHITPVNVPTVKAIGLRANEQFPYPDPKPYQKQMENAVEGTLTPPEDDPEYLRFKREADNKRVDWSNRMIVEYAIAFPDFTTQQEIIDTFAPQREKLRKIADFGDDSDWQITLYHFVFSGNEVRGRSLVSSDFQNVLNIATQTVELTGGEILDGLRTFRTYLSGNTD